MTRRHHLGYELQAVRRCHHFSKRCCKGSRFRMEAAYQPITSFVGRGSTYLFPVSWFKDSPFRETDDSHFPSGVQRLEYVQLYPSTIFTIVRRIRSLGMDTSGMEIPLWTGVDGRSDSFTLESSGPSTSMSVPLNRVSSSRIFHVTSGVIINLVFFDNLPPAFRFSQTSERKTL